LRVITPALSAETATYEESADTYFYQVAYDMGIDRLAEWMSKFGYGHYTGMWPHFFQSR
jgi:cell division protein FtsI/penicillin-binding protein 2